VRVLFLSLDALDGVGGIQRFNTRVIRALGELQAAGRLGEVTSLSLWDRAGVRSVGGVRHRGFDRRKTAFVAGLVREVLRLCPEVVLWGHVLLLRLLPVVKLLAPRARHALFVHGVEVWGNPRYRRVPPFEVLLARRLDRVISVSKVTAECMARAFRIDEDRVALLPNAVDLPPTDPPAPRLGDDELRILSVSRMSPKDSYKGIGTVLRALPDVIARTPLSWTVVGDGELRTSYEDQARQLGLEGVVRFVGRVVDDELERWYRWADVFVLPSAGEGFGIVYLEAWAHGLPVVAARAGGAAEVVEDGRTGLLVEPESPPAVAEALLRLARDGELRARLGTAGRKVVEARYTHAHFRDRLAEILESLRR
jgi:phosphatidylinositol alpha-1,6-mannosyltransferase